MDEEDEKFFECEHCGALTPYQLIYADGFIHEASGWIQCPECNELNTD